MHKLWEITVMRHTSGFTYELKGFGSGWAKDKDDLAKVMAKLIREYVEQATADS